MPYRYVVQCGDDPDVVSLRLLDAKVSLLLYEGVILAWDL